MSQKKWLLAEYWATKATLEVAQSAFLECGAIGIEIDDGIAPEKPNKYPDDTILLKAYFENGDETFIKNSLEHFLTECELPISEITFSFMDEEDWQGNFVRSCTTFVVEPEIYIVPSFEIDKFEKKDRLFIEMDPENAFGTGQHQTTKLCLKNIHEILAKKSSAELLKLEALDVGTGSGILAILMKKLGASSVLATETDKDALITAQKNAQKNDVPIHTLDVSEEHLYKKEAYDLVVANILAHVLIAMADNLAGTFKNGGEIILSGILLDQAMNVRDAFTKVGLTFKKQSVMDDWCSLLFSK